jgi:hypothetical protein
MRITSYLESSYAYGTNPLRYVDACRLFAYGVGIHLIKGEPLHRPDKIDPRADHLSFQVRTPDDLLTFEVSIIARVLHFCKSHH